MVSDMVRLPLLAATLYAAPGWQPRRARVERWRELNDEPDGFHKTFEFRLSADGITSFPEAGAH